MSRESLYLDADYCSNYLITKNDKLNSKIVFNTTNGDEFMRFDLKTGVIFFVKGKLIENNKQVVDGLKELLSCYF